MENVNPVREFVGQPFQKIIHRISVRVDESKPRCGIGILNQLFRKIHAPVCNVTVFPTLFCRKEKRAATKLQQGNLWSDPHPLRGRNNLV